MNQLSPTLFDRSFDDLLELGRSQLPALAPEWTDYNAHDPGITLMELLAWIAEAQLYSLGRMRRDERLAYAALVGVEPRGTRPARGLIWPDRTDPSSPGATFAGSRVIATDAAVRLENHDRPVFHPEQKVLWTPGRITRLYWRSAGGVEQDLTATNDRGIPFFPFNERAGPRDVFVLEFEIRGEGGLFPSRRQEADGALWTVGVRAADLSTPRDENDPETQTDALEVRLVTDTGRFPLLVKEDTSAGLLRTGMLALDLSQVTESPGRFRLEIRAPRGFVRPPRWLRIEPNVIPITERTSIDYELHEANGRPDFTFDLGVPGLCFEPDAEAPRVQVPTDTEFRDWTVCDRLTEMGPEDRVYELDRARGRLLFGNGINGYKPAAGAEIYVSYSVSSGADGNVAPNRKWTVTGFGGVFGTNPDAIAGGARRTDWTELRREGRSHVKEDHALVTAADIESAARALPLMEVARAWVLPRGKGPQLGVVTLVVMRERPGGSEPAEPPETPRWREAVRRRLARRMPLGSRLVVAAPRYGKFFVRGQIEVEPGRDPEKIRKDVLKALKEKLALVKSSSVQEPRAPGVPLARTEVAAWILGVEGVEGIVRLELVSGRKPVEEVSVPHGGLPELDLDQTTTAVTTLRSERGSRT